MEGESPGEQAAMKREVTFCGRHTSKANTLAPLPLTSRYRPNPSRSQGPRRPASQGRNRAEDESGGVGGGLPAHGDHSFIRHSFLSALHARHAASTDTKMNESQLLLFTLQVARKRVETGKQIVAKEPMRHKVSITGSR